MLHGGAFVASCVIGVLFVLAAPGERMLPALAFAGSATVMLGTSTVYHRVRWKRTAARLWMRRADHAGIFLLIAGTYTPIGLISLHGSWRVTILAIVWSGAAVAETANARAGSTRSPGAARTKSTPTTHEATNAPP